MADKPTEPPFPPPPANRGPIAIALIGAGVRPNDCANHSAAAG